MENGEELIGFSAAARAVRGSNPEGNREFKTLSGNDGVYSKREDETREEYLSSYPNIPMHEILQAVMDEAPAPNTQLIFQEEISEIVKRMNALIQEGDYETVIAEYEDLEADAQSNLDIINDVIYAYIGLRNYGGALDFYEELGSNREVDANPRIIASITYAYIGDKHPKGAIDLYDVLKEDNPEIKTSPNIIANVIYAYIEDKHPKEAIDLYDVLKEDNPEIKTSPNIITNIMCAYIISQRNCTKELQELYETLPMTQRVKAIDKFIEGCVANKNYAVAIYLYSSLIQNKEIKMNRNITANIITAYRNMPVNYSRTIEQIKKFREPMVGESLFYEPFTGRR